MTLYSHFSKIELNLVVIRNVTRTWSPVIVLPLRFTTLKFEFRLDGEVVLPGSTGNQWLIAELINAK